MLPGSRTEGLGKGLPRHRSSCLGGWGEASERVTSDLTLKGSYKSASQRDGEGRFRQRLGGGQGSAWVQAASAVWLRARCRKAEGPEGGLKGRAVPASKGPGMQT